MQTSGFVIQPRLPFKNVKDKMLYQRFIDEANYLETNECKIGQLITSITALENEIGWSYGVIRGVLGRLENEGYINIETRSQKRGIKVTIIGYSRFQSLENYKKTNKENNNQETKEEQNDNKENNKQVEHQTPYVPTEKSESEMTDNKENYNQKTNGEQTDNKENRNTITAFITSLNNNNINKTLKEYIADANVKSMNLISTEDIETFVDFALRTNALPIGTSKKIVIAYLDCIRLTRSTCNISAKLLTNFIEKLSKYTVNQIHYALWKHVQQHDDKKEAYTLGILRNTKDHEAIRGLMILKNKKGADLHAFDQTIHTAVGENASSTRAEAQRLEELARSKGLTDGALPDPKFNF